MPTNPRVALFLHSLIGGGAEHVMLQLATSLSELGFEVDMVLVRAAGPLLSQVPAAVKIIDLGARNAYLCLPALIRYLRLRAPEVLLSTFELTSLIALLARRISSPDTRIVIRIATIISEYRRSFIKKKLERFLTSRIYPWADNIVAVSQGAADDFVGYTGIPTNRVKVIYNPVITDQLSSEIREPVYHPFFQDGEPPVVLAAGRLSKEKDFDTLIRSFSRIREHRQARLLILGEGEERTRLNQLARSLGISADVDMPGFVLNPFAFMSRAAVFALSSRLEGLPGVLIQAMACGCPVVSTNCPGGASEILGGGEYGHLVPVGDVRALGEAIGAVLGGDQRKPPSSWLEKFKVGPVVQQYIAAMGLN